jgi:MFS family permease
MNQLHLLILVTSTNHVVMRGANFAVLLTAVHLGASPALVGLLAALFCAPVAFTSVPMGRWFDRRGARLPLLFAALLMSAGSAAAWLWRELGALFIVSLLVGTCYNVFVVNGHQQIGRQSRPGDKVGNYSMYMQANAMANFIAPLITGFAIDGFGHAATFLMLALLPLVSATAIAAGWLRLKPAEPQALAAAAGGRGGALELLKPRLMRGIFTGAVVAFLALNFYSFLMPVYGSGIGLSASEIGMVVSAFSIATVLARGALPAASRRLEGQPLMIYSMAATGAGLMLLPLFTQAGLLGVVSFAVGFVMGAAAPLALAMMNEASPPGREGEVMGLRLSLLNGLQTLVPLAGGALGGVIGVGPVFAVMGVFVVAGAVYMRAQWRAVPD